MTRPTWNWMLGMGSLIAAMAGCSPEDECSYSARVCDVTGDEGFQALAELGATIHSGDDPPDIQGTYLLSPATLESSNFDDPSPPGHVFNAMRITFFNQNFADGTVQVQSASVGGTESGSGVGSLVVGSGDTFTVVARVEGMTSGIYTEQLITYSGTWTNTGIRNLEQAFVMLDTGSDPLNRVVDPGDGRLVVDGDGYSPLESR